MAGQCLGEDHVAARVESRDQLVALVFQVALHGVAATGQRILFALSGIAEPGVQLGLAAVGQVREPPGDLQPGIGCATRAVIVAALPARVGLDGRDLRALGADLVGGGPRADRQHQAGAHGIGMTDDPLQRPGPAHRSADDGGDVGDAERRECGHVGGHLIAHRHQWEPGAPWHAVTRQGAGPGRTAAAAQHVGRHRAPAVGVDGRTGTGYAVPPARRRMTRAGGTGDVRITCQRVQHHDDVVAIR